jgi:hypothetical protein
MIGGTEMPKINPKNQNIPLVDRVNIAKGAARDKKFIDPAQLSQDMLKYDTDYYKTAADRFAQQYPDLVRGRSALLAGAEAPLMGGGDPYAQKALSGAGLGDVNLGKDLEHIAVNTGQPIASAENRGRSYFADLLNGPLNSRLNMEHHQLGISGVDLANVALTNANMARITSDAKTQNAINSALAGVQQGAQTSQAIASGIGTIGSSLISGLTRNSNSNPYLSSGFYGLGTGAFNPNTAASYQLPSSDPDYGNANFIGLGDSAGGGGGSGGW